jgi:hypothetical protein
VRAIRSSGVIVARSGTNPDCHTNPELPKPGRWTPGGFGPQHREMTFYDSIGRTYASRRRTDPRIEAAIIAALSDASSVVNVGAGSGSYEPASTIAAIEPSSVMIAQRPPGSAPVLQAVAERIPLRDQCADAAMALLTVHHWTNVAAGVAELRRIARRRLVFLTWRPAELARYWIADYLPESALIDATSERPVKALTDLLPEARLLRCRSRMTASTDSVPPTGVGRMPTSIRTSAPGSPSSPARPRTSCGRACNTWPTTCALAGGTPPTPTSPSVTHSTSVTVC